MKHINVSLAGFIKRIDKMINTEQMDKKAVYDVMLDLLYTVNASWFKLETQLKGIYASLGKSSELNQILFQLYEDFGRYEAKRLKKTMNIKAGDIDSLIKMLKHSHWCAFENVQTEKLAEKTFRMRTVDCTTQQAAKKRGEKCYDCTTDANRLLRHAFFAGINSSARVRRIFAPPEESPLAAEKNVSCEWEISID